MLQENKASPSAPFKKPFSLSYRNRLHHRREFVQFFAGSQVYRLRTVTIFRKENGMGFFRLGVTFKARMSSVERNAIRRRVRESMRLQAPQLGSFDYNVVISKLERPAIGFARRVASEIGAELAIRTPAPVVRKPDQP